MIIEENCLDRIEADQHFWKYQEDETLGELTDYLRSTYGQHYVGQDDIQTFDVWNSLGIAEDVCRGTAIKYLMRYGKKDGRNRKDLLKAMHYIILMMHYGNPTTGTDK